MQKAKWLSEEALQTAMKRREVKGKGEKKRYTHLNAEFQRIARRDKKDFLCDQCKEIKENNRMGKTRDLKKMRVMKETFHAKMGTIKDRNGMDLLLGRKVMTNLDSILKSRDITLPTKAHLVKNMVFPVVMYGYERWTIKKSEC